MEKKIVVFDINGLRFGLDSSFVTAVCAIPEITFMPSMPDFIAGICRIRGKIVPVVDLGKLMDIAHTDEYRIVILLNASDMEMAITADNIIANVNEASLTNAVNQTGKERVVLPDQTTILGIDFLMDAILQSAEGTI